MAPELVEHGDAPECDDAANRIAAAAAHGGLGAVDEERSGVDDCEPSSRGGGRRRRALRAIAAACSLTAAAAAAAAFASHESNGEALSASSRRTAAAAPPANNRLLKKKKNKDKGGEEEEPEPLLSEEDASKLLHFAIVGFPKTGTSFMEHYLFNGGTDGETHLDTREHCLSKPDAIESLSALVSKHDFEIDGQTTDGISVKNAIKCPHEAYGQYNLGNYEKYFPSIKFVVSTRHPVLWFQSFFNYKLRQLNKHSKGELIWHPSTRDLLGPCATDTPYKYGAPHENKIQDHHNVCTDGAKFHHALSRLGKTPMDTEEELDLLEHHEMSVHHMPQSEIFIMELDQFKVDGPLEQELADQFLEDMQAFLGLERDLPPLYHHESHEIAEELEDYVIDICDEEHDLVRAELIQTGREAYLWIRDYFLDSPGVVVSNREHFLALIERWQYDPCEGEEDDGEDLEEQR